MISMCLLQDRVGATNIRRKLKHWAYEQQGGALYLDKIDVLLAGKAKGNRLWKSQGST